MRLHRFYTVQPLGEEVGIDDVSTIKQWKSVLRYKEGDLVILFNGDGYDYTYKIVSLTKNSSRLELLTKKDAVLPLREVTLCLSLIKNQNFELAVQKCTELGVASIVPILSERSEKKNISKERLARIATEASEQCGRGTVPTIEDTMTFKDACEKFTLTHTLYVGDMSSSVADKHLKGGASALFIGPEGGWGEGDKSLMKQYPFTYISFGNTTLRAETAAIVGVATLMIRENT